jgi:hypothetical protein
MLLPVEKIEAVCNICPCLFALGFVGTFLCFVLFRLWQVVNNHTVFFCEVFVGYTLYVFFGYFFVLV